MARIELNPTDQQVPVSVVVLTHNEERNLATCLESLTEWATEIFVVDSGSTDRTLEIAARYGGIVVEHPFDTHAKQWNWALENLPLSTEWVLALDADQHVTPALRAEITELLGSGVGGAGREASGGTREKRAARRGQLLEDVNGFYVKRQIRLRLQAGGGEQVQRRC